MDRTCPRCSTPVSSSDDACPHCGGSVTPGGAPSASAAAETPPVLPARYAIQTLLGRGGMGRVYLCRDSILDVDVAVKVLRPELAADEKAVRRVEAEARAAARLRGHPRILSLYAFENYGDSWFLVMEYAPGGTLFARIREAKRLPERGCRRVAIEVAEALAFAHGAGVLHRDIKPGNVLLDIQGGVKVADFGLAHIVGTGGAIPVEGTPVYMAPEAIGRRAVDARSDLYALGAMLFELATGSPPFRGSVAEIRDAKLSPDLRAPDPREFRPDLSEGFADIVRRLLEPEPAVRYPDAATVVEAIRALDGRVEKAIPVLPAARVPAHRPQGMEHGRSAGSGTGLLIAGGVLAAGAGVWLFLGGPGGGKEEAKTPPPAPVAPSAADAPVKKVTEGLVVITKPPGATVFVDGNSVGTTGGEDGLVVRDLTDGSHRVSAHLEDHEPDEQTATWRKGEANAPVVLRLLPQKGIFAIEGGRPGARAVLRDGERIVRQFTLDSKGATEPELLEAGSFTLSAEAPGFKTWTGPARIRSGKNPPFRVELAEADGILSLETDPPGAKVHVDDRDFGVSPVRGIALAPGKHTIRLDHPDTSDDEREVELRAGETKDLGTLKLPPLAEAAPPALPPGVTALLDGKPFDGPVRRKAGYANLVYTLEGHQNQRFPLTLRPGANKVPSPEKWKSVPGFVDLSAFKREAEDPKAGVRQILIDGGYVDPPFRTYGHSPGVHTLTLGKTGERLITTRFRIRVGETLKVLPPETQGASFRASDYWPTGRFVEGPLLAAFEWLHHHQSPDGLWRADKFEALCRKNNCGGAGNGWNSVGVTGLALMALLGEHGIPEGDGGATLAGLGALLGYQHKEGFFGSDEYLKAYRDPKNGRVGAVYDQPIATTALVRGYRATGQPLLKAGAQKGLNFIAECRNPYLAWRYGVKPQDNDTSVTAWMVRALHEGREAGLVVDPDGFEGARAYLEKVTEPEYGRAGYTARGNGPARPEGLFDRFPSDKSESLTAAAVHTRMLCGATKDDEYVKKGCDLLLKCLPVYDERAGTIDYYYWHYGTLALFREGGDHWKKWNESLRKALIDSQRQDKGDDRWGSWDAVDPWYADGGRVYSTAINALTLREILVPLRGSRGPVSATRISITSKPPGAQVELEGEPLGATPLKDVPVPAGKGTLRLLHADRGEVVREIETPAFRTTDLGTVDFPPGATLDLSEFGKVTVAAKGRLLRGKVALPSGKILLEFHSPGHWPVTREIDLPGGGTVKPEGVVFEAAPEWEGAAVKGLPAPPKPSGDLPPLPAGFKAVGGRIWAESDGAEVVPFRGAVAGGPPKEPLLLVDRTEVTVAQFRKYCTAEKKTMATQATGALPAWPVMNVSLAEAQDYARWAGRRLPTWAEWTRLREGTPEGAGNLGAKDDGFEGPAPVGRFPQGMGALGWLDAFGNAAEWCSDGQYNGGSWYSNRVTEKAPKENFRAPSLGFRCVVALTQEK